MANKRLRDNPWIIGIGTTVIATLILKGIDAGFNTTILFSIWNAIKSFFAWFGIFVDVPIWGLLTLIIGCLFIGGLAVANAVNSAKKPSIQTAPFIKYTEDIFENILWKWKYEFTGNTYKIVRLIPYCPKDNCMIFANSCPICQKGFYNFDYAEEKVKILINHKIDNNLHHTKNPITSTY